MTMRAFLRRFFRAVESVPCGPREEETIDGQAFEYKTYPLAQAQRVMPTDNITATVIHADGRETVVTENIKMTGTIDAKPTEWLFFGLLTAFAMPFAGALIAAVHMQEE